MKTNLLWYVDRARAMSRRELAWRAGDLLRRPMRAHARGDTFSPRWDDGRWNGVLRDLVASSGDRLAADAARIAEGNLELWGHEVQVDLRGVDWHTDPLSGRASARSWRERTYDQKPLWELHRQQHLFPLAAAGFAAAQDDWRRLAADHILHWIARNPARNGPGWRSGYESSHRLLGWAFSVPLLTDTLRSDELARVNSSYAAQANFVAARPSRYSSANNHRLAELVGLLAASVVGFTGVSWRSLWTELEDEVVRQTYGDGGSREQAAGYFLYVLEILWCAAVLAVGRGEELGRLNERFHAMLAWLTGVARPDLEPPAMGDDAEDRMLRPDYFEERRARVIAGRVRSLLNGKPTLGTDELGPDTRSRLFAESGYAVLRSGHVRVVFDVGELGFGPLAAHGHADALSVVVDAGNRPFLRDSGTGLYRPPEIREAFKSTAAHNTVVVDGLSQAESRGPHLWGRRFLVEIEANELGDSLDYVRASHDGYRRRRARAHHTRSVTFVKPTVLVVLDRVVAEKTCDTTLTWQHFDHAVPPTLDVEALPPAHRVEGSGPSSDRYTWIGTAPRSTWTASGNEIIFVTAIGLGTTVHIASLRHENGATRVDLRHEHRTVITEDWRSPMPKIET